MCMRYGRVAPPLHDSVRTVSPLSSEKLVVVFREVSLTCSRAVPTCTLRKMGSVGLYVGTFGAFTKIWKGMIPLLVKSTPHTAMREKNGYSFTPF